MIVYQSALIPRKYPCPYKNPGYAAENAMETTALKILINDFTSSCNIIVNEQVLQKKMYVKGNQSPFA